MINSFSNNPTNVEPHQEYWVIDACVLMSSVLRPWLLALSQAGFFFPILSSRIGVEWTRNASRIWSVPAQELEDMWQQIIHDFPTSLCDDYEAYERVLKYSDAKDRHVIAAGLASRARHVEIKQVGVLTWNLKDFNKGELRRAAVSLSDPDRLLTSWFLRDSVRFVSSLDVLHSSLRQFGREHETLAETLRRERLFQLAKLMASHTALGV